MRSLPDKDSKAPVKNNILWLLMRYRMDIDIFYRTLQNMRKMPTGKDKYRSIERALRELDKEGWPIIKEIDKHGITWYSAGPSFKDFLLVQFEKETESIAKESIMREMKRFNEIIKLKNKMEKYES